MKKAKTVNGYISNAPEEIRERLNDIRNAIKEAAPDASEKISYGMPYYDYKGRLVYFAYAKKHIGLYVPPPIVADHKKELTDYETATAAIRFPNDKKLPLLLIKKLVKARVRWNDKTAKKK